MSKACLIVLSAARSKLQKLADEHPDNKYYKQYLSSDDEDLLLWLAMQGMSGLSELSRVNN